MTVLWESCYRAFPCAGRTMVFKSDFFGNVEYPKNPMSEQEKGWTKLLACSCLHKNPQAQ